MSNHEEAFQAASAKLSDVIGQIRALLREDLAGWPERELHKRFVATEEADLLSDVQVADLKAQATALGRYFVTTVDSELSELALWTAPLAEDQNRCALCQPFGASLAQSPHKWMALQGDLALSPVGRMNRLRVLSVGCTCPH